MKTFAPISCCLLSITCFFLLAPCVSEASWYWPFESPSEAVEGENGEKKGKDEPRLSDLMEPATTNIDAAADFASEGKYKEAQDCYRAALAALDALERDPENAAHIATPAFATVRNKRAYVNAALDTLLLAEARENAKAVAVTDTTDLEVRMALKPWKEFLETYAALTNDYRIITNRMAYVEESDEVHTLLNAINDKEMQQVCLANFTGMATNKGPLIAQWHTLQKSHDSSARAVNQLARFSKSVGKDGGVRIFDICRKDVRTGVTACQTSWPRFGDSLAAMNRCLEGLHGVLREVAAQRDFAFVAKSYVAHVKGRTLTDAEEMAKDLGYFRAYGTMIDALNEAKWGEVYTGVLARVEMNWGGAKPEVPTKEDDRGLVKDDGDTRPEVTSQLDTYMEKERTNTARVNKKAKKFTANRRAKTAVQREIAKLLKEDPKSRKARLLMAGEDLRGGDTAAAREKVQALLDEKPNDGPALNLRAAIEAAEGDWAAAEKSLDQAIHSNPRDYHAYYNMANIYLQKGNTDGARRYYETGRSFAGPKNAALEKAVRGK